MSDGILGQYEFVKKGDPPVMGLSKVPDEHTFQHLMRPRLDLAARTPVDAAPIIELPVASAVTAPPL